MKKKLLLLAFILSAFSGITFAQTPQGFNYQAIARDGSGNPIINTSLQVKLAVLADSLGNTVYWEELFNPVTTNAFGLFTVIMGRGARQATSSAAAFSSVDWSVTPIFIRTQIYYSGAWKNMGTTRMWSVPYALNANSLSGTQPYLNVKGNTAAMDSALFVVRNNNGQIIFAVYNEGVRIYVDDGLAKGTAKGGFAIGGFGTAKGPSQEYFRVTRDSTRVYVNQLAKGATKGGFAIGGFNPSKGQDTTNYMNINILNSFIGYGSGINSTPGQYNSFIGYHTGFNNSGSYNNLIGYKAGTSNTTGYQNTFMGYLAGYANSTGAFNTFLGNQAGQYNQTGSANTFVGNLAGQNSISGNYNTMIGTIAGVSLNSGANNTYLGVGAGAYFQNGSSNIFIGAAAGAGVGFAVGTTGGLNNVVVGTSAAYSLTTGSNNLILGNNAGFANTSGANNVFEGYRSGYSNTTGNYNLFIGYMAGNLNTSGKNNTFLGYLAGYSNNGDYNVFLGHQSGYSNTSGVNNTFLGYTAGYTNSTGNYNIFIGNATGYSNTIGSQNLFLGDNAGYWNTSGSQNTFLGLQAGRANTTGGGNAFVGWNAGLQNTTGANNAFFGLGAGYSNTTAYYNTAIGFSAGLLTQTGQYNTYLGSNAGRSNAAGDNNVVVGESAMYSTSSGAGNTVIGEGAGYNITSGTGNVLIGFGAAGNETAISDRLFIENSSGNKNTALIYGEFDNNLLTFNANVGIGKTSPVAKLDITSGNWDVLNGEGDFRIGDGTYRFKIGVANGGGGAGDVRMTAHGGTNRLILGGGGKDILLVTNANVMPWTDNFSTLGAATNRWLAVYSVNGTIQTSDARLKSNISSIPYGLETILKLEPVSFNWKDENGGKLRLGLIAQDVQKVIGEVVDEGKDQNKTLGINYSELVPVLIKGMQEQQGQLDAAKAENRDLREQLKALWDEVRELKTQGLKNNK
jgi:hypothetical protein